MSNFGNFGLLKERREREGRRGGGRERTLQNKNKKPRRFENILQDRSLNTFTLFLIKPTEEIRETVTLPSFSAKMGNSNSHISQTGNSLISDLYDPARCCKCDKVSERSTPRCPEEEVGFERGVDRSSCAGHWVHDRLKQV